MHVHFTSPSDYLFITGNVCLPSMAPYMLWLNSGNFRKTYYLCIIRTVSQTCISRSKLCVLYARFYGSWQPGYTYKDILLQELKQRKPKSNIRQYLWDDNPELLVVVNVNADVTLWLNEKQQLYQSITSYNKITRKLMKGKFSFYILLFLATHNVSPEPNPRPSIISVLRKLSSTCATQTQDVPRECWRSCIVAMCEINQK